jgi:hypothetical protein
MVNTYGDRVNKPDATHEALGQHVTDTPVQGENGHAVIDIALARAGPLRAALHELGVESVARSDPAERSACLEVIGRMRAEVGAFLVVEDLLT